MFVYGSKSKELAKEIIIEKCPNCGSQNSLDMHVFQKYAYLSWLPLFPIGKTGVSECTQCRQVLKSGQMPPAVKTAYDNLKAQTRTPWWTFIGSALFAIFIAWLVVADRANDKENAILILSPHMGDVFDVKTKAGAYTLYKVAKVKGDSVFVRINEFEVCRRSGLPKIRTKGDAAFPADLYGFSKTELKEMLASAEIVDITRE